MNPPRLPSSLLRRTPLAAALLIPILAVPLARADDTGLRRSEAKLVLDYQTVRVQGDRAIDLAGLHLYTEVADGLSVGAGLMGPLIGGQYGGFMGASVGLQGRVRLGGRLVGLAALSAGGGAGGRSPEHAKKLSGTGSFVRGQLGLGYEAGGVTVGAGVSAIKFRKSLIDSRQLNAFVEIPFTYLSGPYAARGQALSKPDDERSAREMGETMLSVSFDNYRQLHPAGSYSGTVRTGEFQFSHFLSPDLYWFANFASAYAGLPTYNQLLGGLGWRWRVAPSWRLYAQLGVGSGGYAPEQIDTGPGLLVYPKLSAELALSKDIGLAATAGYLTAPKGSSRNPTYGLTLTRHLRAGQGRDDAPAPAVYQGLRVTLLHQSDTQLRYRDVARPALHMLGLQLDLPISERWYLPVQASAAYTSYLGYPGYAEVFTGLGVQTRVLPGERLQWFSTLMAGANVHGKSGKLNAGLRYLVDERLATSLSLGRIEAESPSGGRYSANNVVLGLDYRFAIPTR